MGRPPHVGEGSLGWTARLESPLNRECLPAPTPSPTIEWNSERWDPPKVAAADCAPRAEGDRAAGESGRPNSCLHIWVIQQDSLDTHGKYGRYGRYGRYGKYGRFQIGELSLSITYLWGLVISDPFESKAKHARYLSYPIRPLTLTCDPARTQRPQRGGGSRDGRQGCWASSRARCRFRFPRSAAGG